MDGTIDNLPLSQIEGDEGFRLRPEGDVAGLAQSIARDGQLLPIEVRLRSPGSWQLITGFRRVAALRLLKREHVLARLHDSLSDEEALGMALADDLLARPLSRDELGALRDRLIGEGKYGPSAQEAVERALGEAPLPPEPEEQDLDVFSRDLAGRLPDLSSDLASLYEVWAEVDERVAEEIRSHLRYLRDLLPFMEASATEPESPKPQGETDPVAG